MKKEIEQLISEVPHNGSLRFNCPICRGYNSLGITKENGKAKYHCFRAGCNLKPGYSKYTRGIPELKTHSNGSGALKEDFRIPEHLLMGLSSEKCVQMILKGHCLEVYRQGLFDIAYDPKQDRLCFVIKDKNKVVGLVGKACNYKTLPKVLNYSDSDIPFIVGNTDTIVLVEDCLSAASVCRIPEYSGLALLGTNLKPENIPLLKTYKHVIVALDRDARKKALAIKRKLCYYHSSVELWFLDKDIKDQTNEELLIEDTHGK